MGTGPRPDNQRATSTNTEILTADGVSAVRCDISATVAAELMLPSRAGTVGVVCLNGADVAVVVDDEVVALLPPGGTTSRLASCLRRGHSYSATIVGPSQVRVEHAG